MNFLLGTRATPNLPPHLFDEGERGAALIEKATSDILLQVDWAAMMEVVDAINHASDQAVKRELVRQIRKRLQSRSTRVVHMALELTEAVVKNGNESVHREVATPKFMNTMARVARAYAERSGKENLEVAEKTLELIQSWGETFLPYSTNLPLFAETYHVLRKEGLPFRKQYDETKAPVLTPPPSAPSARGGSGAAAFQFDSGAGGAGAGAGSIDLSDSSLGVSGSEMGLPPPELVRRAAAGQAMLEEMLHAAQTREELMANGALPQVLAQCQRLARALQQGIEARVGAGSAEFLEEYFAANDALQAALQLYSGVKDRKVLLPLPGGPAAKPAEPEPELLDLDDFLSMSSSAAPAVAGGGKAGPAGARASASTPSPVPTGPGGAASSRTPTPTADVPRLAPSRRDSFDKEKNAARQSFRRRSGSGGAPAPGGGGGFGSVGGLSSDFLQDVASLDISGTSAGGAGASAGGVFASNASSITDAPEFRTTAGGAAPAALPADPFASAPPVPILPPPRSIASPSTTTTTTASFPSPPPPASAFLSAPGNMTAAGAMTAGPMAFPPFAQQEQQLQPPPLQAAPAYGSLGGLSSSSMGGGYPPQQQLQQQQSQPPQGAMAWVGADPFAQPPAVQGQQQQPARPVSYPQPTTATGGPAGASQNPFDLF